MSRRPRRMVADVRAAGGRCGCARRRGAAALARWLAMATSGLLICLAAVAARAQPPDEARSHGSDPKAFIGLAQAPEANLFLGTATTSIPIQVPPGRKNLTPQLALAYTSGAGPSAFGYGWELPLGRVQRSTKHGVLTCANLAYVDDFVLILPGTNIEFTRNPASGVGIARVQESFLKIRQNGNTWEVWDKSGIKYTFGDSLHARTGNDPFDFYHPDSCHVSDSYDPLYTFSWSLTRIEDPNGNRVEIDYLHDVNLAPPFGAGVAYPDRLRYGGNPSAGLAHQFEVDFVWSDEDGFSRPAADQVLTGMGGFGARLTKLLSRIVIRHPVGGDVVRWYGFDYELDVGAERLGRQSFLSAVTLYDRNNHALARYDGQPVSTTFLYRDSALGFATATYQTGPSVGGYGRAENHGTDSFTGRDIFDINGDGFEDLVDASACDASSPSTRRWAVMLGSASGFATSVVWDFNVAGPAICHIRGDRVTGGSLRHRWGRMETLDINGDGLPDWVDSDTWSAATPYWNVYLGYVTQTGGGFETIPTPWSAPFPNLRHVYTKDDIGGYGYNGRPGSVTLRDLVDLNGDGLLDLVETPDVGQTGPWTVWVNTGSGFDLNARLFPAAFPMLRWTRHQDVISDEVLGLYDLNGDGLPDLVFAPPTGPWQVHLNTGLGLDQSPESWIVPAPLDARWLRRTFSAQDGVGRQLLDINGDGLLDLVDSAGWNSITPYWRVALNRGDGLSSQVENWDSPLGLIRGDDGSGTLTEWDTIDIDGDGLPDVVDFRNTTTGIRIYRNRGGAWCASTDGNTCASNGAAAQVVPNPDGMRPDLLVQLENGVGGTTALEYRPSTQWDNTGGDGIPDLPLTTWSLTRIERDDGLCDASGANCLTAGDHRLATDLTYLYGRFDALERVFRGFQIVSAIDGASTASVRQGRTTYFHQNAALAGKISEEHVYDATGGGTFSTKPLKKTVNTWECANRITGTPMTSCPGQPAGGVWARLKTVVRRSYSNFQLSVSKATVTDTISWHQCGGKFYGNASHTVIGNDSATLQVHSHAEYACLDNPTTYLVDKPTHVWTTGTGDSGPPLEEKWFFYDDLGTGGIARGNVTRVESWLDQWTDPPSACTAAGKQCVGTRMEYDAYGNVVRVTDALGRATTTQYDAIALYPSVVTGPSPFAQKKATAYDPACGALLWETIAYTGGTQPAERSRRELDTFCRLARTAQPGEDIDVEPHQSVAYSLGGPGQATVVTTQTRETGNPFGYRYESTLTDAFGRVLQRNRSPAVVDGVGGTISSLTVEFDARGNPSAEYVPFFVSGIGGTTYRNPPSGTGVTANLYDALGRPTRVTNPDGSFRELDHTVAWQTTVKDECYTSGSCAGGKNVEIRDAFGRVTEKRLYEQATFRTRTLYAYDALGRLISTRQGSSESTVNSNTIVATTYDTLGRKVQFDDPDSGTWKYGYDAVGNLLYQDDPKANQHVQFCYDALNRVTLECPKSGDYQPTDSIQGRCNLTCSSDEVRYAYGTSNTAVNYALGRLVQVVDPSGRTTFDLYDVRGRLAQVTKTIDGAGDGQAVTTATTKYGYDAADHLAHVVYPDGEIVAYTYSSAGQVTRVRSQTHGIDYLSALTYDVFGRPRLLTHGNGATDRRTYYGKENGFRLSSLLTQSAGQNRLAYLYLGYTATGLLTGLADFGPKGTSAQMDNSATFAYDGLGRLTAADGPGIGPNTYQFDYLGNLTSKEGVSLTYFSGQPHTLRKINGSTTGVTHDANGNRGGKPSQQYVYDKKDRLTTIDVGSRTVSFRYDYSGRRVAKVGDDGSPTDPAVTIYYNELMEAAGGWVTKYYFAGDLLIATRREQNGAFAAATSGPVMVAATSLARPAMILVLRRDVQVGVMLSVLALGTVLLLVPGRRKCVAGLALRNGHVLGVTVAFVIGTFPWPLVLRPAPAEAQCGPLPSVVYHYHLDHLGSTQLITNQTGGVVEYVRYKPYGEIRGRFRDDGTALFPNEIHRHEFTGYESELLSNLQYAGARFYDAALGMFLTHDPARQFPSPYSYGGGDPINGTDPSGAIFGIDDGLFVFLVVAAFAVAALDAGLKTGSVAEAFKAGAIGAGVSVATVAVAHFVVGPITDAVLTPTMEHALNLASVGAGAYSAADAFRNGNNATGVLGSLLTAYGLADLLDEAAGPAAAVELDAREYLVPRSNQLSPNVQNPPNLEIDDLKPGDVLLTGEGGTAPLFRGTGDYGHAAVVTDAGAGRIRVLSSDARGVYTANNGDPAVGGRTWDVFRLRTVRASAVQRFAQTQATKGGFIQYLGNHGGNICSSVVARAVEAGGGPFAPRVFGNIVTPNGLAGAYGPPIGRIKVPLLANP